MHVPLMTVTWLQSVWSQSYFYLGFERPWARLKRRLHPKHWRQRKRTTQQTLEGIIFAWICISKTWFPIFTNRKPKVSPLTCFVLEARNIYGEYIALRLKGKINRVIFINALCTKNVSPFFRKHERYCICSQPGQVPCPGLIPLPKPWRGKYFHQGHEDEEE